MITVDERCSDKACKHKGVYRMVGSCQNCGLDRVLVLFTAGHETRQAECPKCQCQTVGRYRSATDDEIPEAT